VTATPQVIVIGAGISGLACGYYLQNLGIRVIVLEQSGRPGGLIRSVPKDGYLLEEGPQSFLLTSPMLDMIRALGIESALLRADPRAARYVLLRGRLEPVPLAPPQLFGSSLLSARTKWSFLRDAFGHSRPPQPDESIAGFVRRKFTEELLDRLVGPFVSGVYAGDPERLSLRGAFPVVHELETRYGSVIRGAMKSRGERGGARLGSCSFESGNETLLSALGKALGDVLRLNSSVETLARKVTHSGPEYILTAICNGARQTLRAGTVIVATPASTAGRLLAPLSPRFEELLGAIEYAPVALLYTAFEKSRVGHSLSGFGFLVPRSEGKRLLGTVWNSSLFPARAPAGSALLTSFAGGTGNPLLAAAAPEDIRDALLSELRPVLSVEGEPAFWWVKQYTHAIPQYNLGHPERVRKLKDLCASHRGLLLAGNYLEGPAVGACIDVARRVASEAQSYLRSGGA
jgi:oxygen-dependent protoporphyrinogen oxidase